MAIASYGFMFFSCTGTMVAIGGATALDTLCGQALTSTNNPTILGLFLQQCIVILLLIFGLLITPIWLLSGRLFIALGQDFEILAMMAARLDNDSIGAQSILKSSSLLLTTISLGLSVAASHRIANFLGANRGSLAPTAITASYLLAFLTGAIEFAVIMLARRHYGYPFTRSPSVATKTARVLPLMAAFQVLDLSNGAAGGVLRGAGKNHLSGACNFVAYYGVGLTTGYLFWFQRGWGLFGLWAGIIAGSGALLLLQTACIMRISWDELGREVSKRHQP
ncbi:hypothetical protein BU16DRAFT_617592 [Lophium mytilinum]|uniref:Mate-domain-containing protein n=1 Tax=Lophium mytilinum TaxID=390894 RepID=A0A6A6QYG3_9PEZI|nr:hypothetical protein BU16DRAFT_617592 [Lophium mytilinum]